MKLCQEIMSRKLKWATLCQEIMSRNYVKIMSRKLLQDYVKKITIPVPSTKYLPIFEIDR